MGKTALFYHSGGSSGYESMMRDSEATGSASSTQDSMSENSSSVGGRCRSLKAPKKRANSGRRGYLVGVGWALGCRDGSPGTPVPATCHLLGTEPSLSKPTFRQGITQSSGSDAGQSQPREKAGPQGTTPHSPAMGCGGWGCVGREEASSCMRSPHSDPRHLVSLLKDQEYCSLEPLKGSGHCSYTYVEKEMANHSSILA